MTSYLKFQADNCSNAEQQIIQYFEQYGFNFEQNSHELKFIRRSSFLDSWIFNPLKWGAEIIVSVNNQEIEAKFTIDTAAKIVTAEVKDFWHVFIENLKQYVVHGIPFQNANSEAAIKAKKSILKTLAFTILAIIICGIIGSVISHFTGWTMMGYLGILIGAFLVLKNKQGKENLEKAL